MGEHTVGEHTVREHTVREHTVREHTVREHTVREHAVREHTVREHTAREHTVRDAHADVAPGELKMSTVWLCRFCSWWLASAPKSRYLLGLDCCSRECCPTNSM